MKHFLGFALISGVGWLLDFTSYVIFTQIFKWDPFYANFASSMVGVTYVWFFSLKRLFKLEYSGGLGFLIVYWVFQAGSISAYSKLVSLTVAAGVIPLMPGYLPPPAVVAKIFFTPFNLITNFVFMKFLTKRMRGDVQ